MLDKKQAELEAGPEGDYQKKLLQEYVAEAEAKLKVDSVPLSFLSQINLEAVQRVCELPNLPKAGIL